MLERRILVNRAEISEILHGEEVLQLGQRQEILSFRRLAKGHQPAGQSQIDVARTHHGGTM